MGEGLCCRARAVEEAVQVASPRATAVTGASDLRTQSLPRRARKSPTNTTARQSQAPPQPASWRLSNHIHRGAKVPDISNRDELTASDYRQITAGKQGCGSFYHIPVCRTYVKTGGKS